MTTGEVIQSQRKKAGLSQEKVAELVGTSRQAVTKWEAGQSIPCMENRIRLAQIFKISLAELSTGEGGGNGNGAPVQKSKPLIPLLHNLSLIGYITVAVAGAGFHQFRILGRGLPYIVWIIIACLGGLCLGVRNAKYRSQWGKLPSLVPDLIYLTIVLFVPRIPVPDGFSILLMQTAAVLFIMLYLYRLCPWRRPEHKDKKPTEQKVGEKGYP